MKSLALLFFLVALSTLALAERLPRVAVLDFTRANAPAQSSSGLHLLTQAVQARLFSEQGFLWVERQELKRIQNESELVTTGGTHAMNAVRLGNLLRADLLLTGELVASPGDKAGLSLEVIDLRRADTLGQYVVPITIHPQRRYMPTEAEIAAIATVAKEALSASWKQLVETSDHVVLAPLHLSATGKTDRLGFVESLWMNSIDQEARLGSGVRILRFPKSELSKDEAGLILFGLTETSPDAVQSVAHAYAWGTITEQQQDGVAFEDVPVTIEITVWVGSGAPQSLGWKGTVKTIEAGLKELAVSLLTTARATKRASQPNSQERKSVAALLEARADAVNTLINTKSEYRILSTAGQQQARYRARLLETACFFDPLNRRLNELRMEAKWPERGGHEERRTLQEWWLLTEDYAGMSKHHALGNDSRPDGIWPRRQTKQLHGFFKTLSNKTRGVAGWNLTQEEAHRQLAAVAIAWSKAVVDAQRSASVAGALPWLAAAEEQWLQEMVEIFSDMRDPLVRRAIIESVWPALKPAVGALLHSTKDDDAFRGNRVTEPVFSTYYSFADNARALALMDEAWKAYDGTKTTSSAPATPKPVMGIPMIKQVDLPWEPKPMAAIPKGSEPAPDGLPDLPAGIVTTDVRPITAYTRNAAIDGPMWQPTGDGHVDALCWHDGRLWIAEADRQKLPEGSGPPNLYYNEHYSLWMFDPVRQTRERVSTALGDHSPIKHIMSDGTYLWLSMSADGIWRYSPKDKSVRRFGSKDGVMSLQTHHGIMSGDDLFFLGGEYPDFVISRYSPAADKWTGYVVPVPKDTAKRATEAKARGGQISLQNSPGLAVSGQWLNFNADWSVFLDLTTGQWVDLLNTPDPSAPPKPNLPKSNFAFALSGADERGFWFGTGGGGFGGSIWFIDPLKPWDKKNFIPLPDRPRAVFHRGQWLWALLPHNHDSSQLILINKDTMAKIGRLLLPSPELRSLTASAGMIWAAGAAAVFHSVPQVSGLPMLVEVRLKNPGLCPPEPHDRDIADASVLHAAWRGDALAVSKMLTTQDAPSATSSDGWTALMWAANQGNHDMAQALLANKANPNHITPEGDTALLLAVARGDAEMVKLLLTHGTNPNLASRRKFRDLTRTREWVIASANSRTPDKFSEQPENIKARITEDGDVALSWTDKADDEDYFMVRLSGESGYSVLPPNSKEWVDRIPKYRTPLVYEVGAVNGHMERVPPNYVNWDAVPHPVKAVTVARPEPAAHVTPYQYGVAPGFGSAQLPAGGVRLPPLSRAVLAGRVDLVKILLEHKADPNVRDAYESSPLLLAARYRQYEIARALLTAGAETHVVDITGESAAGLVYLHHEDRELLAALLKAMPPDRCRLEATTLITEAAGKGQTADIEWLQSLGGNLGGRIVHGKVALGEALGGGHSETALWLWKNLPDLKSRWMQGSAEYTDGNVMRQLARSNNATFLKQLLQDGLPPDILIEHNPIAVYAAENKAFALLDLLKEHGADFTLKGSYSRSALEYLSAAERKRYEADFGGENMGKEERPWKLPVGYELLSAGPTQLLTKQDPNKTELKQRVFAAIAVKDLAALSAALEAGAELESVSAEGRTPLLEAIYTKASPLALYLIEAGASVNTVSRMGSSPLAMAIGQGLPDVVERLLQSEADPNLTGLSGITPLGVAAFQGNIPLIERLIERGADSRLGWQHQATRNQITPVCQAAWRGNIAVVDLLLARGADPKAQNYNLVSEAGSSIVRVSPLPTTLMYAAAGKNLALVKRLHSLGLDPKVQTSEGYDALSWAAGQGALDVVKYLYPHSKKEGRALEQAYEKNHTIITDYLQSVGYQSR